MAYDDTIKKTLPMITSTFGSFLQNLFGGQLPSIQPQVMSDQDGFTNRDSLINRGIIPGNDTAANSGYALPSIMNSADLGTGRTPPPIVPGSVGLQAAPPIADTGTTPPGPVVGGQPPPIVGQTVMPNLPALTSFSNPDIGTGRTPLPEAQPAPDQPTMMAGGNAYHAPVYEAPRERPIGNWFQPGAPDSGTSPVISVPGAATPAPAAARPQTDEEKYNATYRSYGRGTWKLDDGSITHDPKKYKADIDAHPNSTVREVREEPGADRKKKWSIWEKLGNAALGWAQGGIVGGVQGATDRNWWRKQQDAATRADLLPKIQAQQKMRLENAKIATELGKPGIEQAKILKDLAGFKNQMDIAKMKSDDDKGKAVAKLNEKTGNLEWTYPNDTTRPNTLVTGADGKAIRPDQYNWTDPQTNEVISGLTAQQRADLGFRRSESQLGREQQVKLEQFKAANDAQIENIKAGAVYQKALLDQAQAALTAKTGMISNNEEVQGIAQKIAGLTAQINEAQDPTYDPAEIKRREKLWADMSDAQSDLTKAFGRTKAGKAMLEGVQKLGIKPPTKYVPGTLTAAGTGGKLAGKVYTSPEAMQKKFPGLTPEQIREKITAEGGSFQN